MPTPILMPALSPTMTEGKLAKWLKKEGDAIKSGDVLAEIETDKATMEVEAVDEGTLGRIVVAAGTENVAVNAPIAYMLNEGESPSALDAIGKAAPAAPKPAAPSPAAPAPVATPAPAAAPAPKPAVAPAPAPVAAKDGQRIFASPLARRLAGEANLDLARIQGSGPHGRIVKADVEGAKSSGVAAAPAAAAAPSAPAPRPAAAAPAAASATPLPTEGFTELPLSTMRKVIARRLMESKQTIPHFYLTVEADIDALLALRTQLNAKAGEGVKLSVNDLVIKACGMALARVPRANAIWGGDKILLNKTCDVSVAVALDDGLITPIIRSVDKKGLAAISSEMKSLAERAKVGKLLPEEYQGGAFSLSNLGMFGIKEFAAVINPPQGSILAVGKGEQRAVVKGGALAVATMMSCTISCDHRVIDGAIGAQFLDAIKKLLEDPITMML
ncbi:acetyltransferase component of pyruvate dehydrogenase complex [Hypericibacter terrae]|uniref:Acetyltransferase component of pyruvate dehydrogenase complex n=1 Tax=Hypericibacter terrae TaxID=2602015 RepID=A0A5J6MI89_9PROT|nr:pyruvate dehydrogenase complex dihydrolipoamide acetyltransferase [Hypericibacter terrae]QEX17242.1 acetyltransferase component of pyruvate dehydrogenase complex [Hypericibacter terrae]